MRDRGGTFSQTRKARGGGIRGWLVQRGFLFGGAPDWRTVS